MGIKIGKQLYVPRTPFLPSAGRVSLCFDPTNNNQLTVVTDDGRVAVLGDYAKMVRSGKDGDGIFTTIEYFDTNNTLRRKHVLSKVSSSYYNRRVDTFYDADGDQIGEFTYELVYDVDGDLTGEQPYVPPVLSWHVVEATNLGNYWGGTTYKHFHEDAFGHLFAALDNGVGKVAVLNRLTNTWDGLGRSGYARSAAVIGGRFHFMEETTGILLRVEENLTLTELPALPYQDVRLGDFAGVPVCHNLTARTVTILSGGVWVNAGTNFPTESPARTNILVIDGKLTIVAPFDVYYNGSRELVGGAWVVPTSLNDLVSPGSIVTTFAELWGDHIVVARSGATDNLIMAPLSNLTALTHITSGPNGILDLLKPFIGRDGYLYYHNGYQPHILMRKTSPGAAPEVVTTMTPANCQGLTAVSNGEIIIVATDRVSGYVIAEDGITQGVSLRYGV